MPLDQQRILAEIDAVLLRVDEARKQARTDDLSDLGDTRLAEIVTLIHQAIDRFSPPGSRFRSQAESIAEKYGLSSLHFTWPKLTGVLQALRVSHEQGYLLSIQELVHADLFSDFLEMADYLLREGYKDPSAVLVGGVLEEHLRKICNKHGVPTTDARDGKPRKSDTLNADLAKQGVFDKLEQKNVTAWLDLRNKAAHGHYTTYDTNHVDLMLRGVRDFISRYRA